MKETEKEGGSLSAENECQAELYINNANIDKSVINTLESALREAEEFFDKFQISEILQPCNKKQMYLFNIYFARYCLLKRGYELNRLVSSPSYETVRKIPIIGSFVGNLKKDNDDDIVASRLLQMVGEEMAKRVVEENVYESGNALAVYTMPSTIERAANLLSNTFLEHHKSKSGMRMQAIEGVKDRFKLVENQ
jgi:hypothetical protein